MIKSIKVGKNTFQLIKRRAYVPVNVYKGPELFLRIGEKNIVQKELTVHKKLYKLGFPFAKIVEHGKKSRQEFFIEQSLGALHYGQIFAKDLRVKKTISNTNFKNFLKVSQRFAKAQLKTTGRKINIESFAKGINFYHILKELPELKGKFNQAFNLIVNRLRGFPFVLTHGDFSPFNIYPKGVIDLESFFIAPAGYDLVSNICHTEFFPKSKRFELSQKYWFSTKQKKQYLQMIDTLYTSHKLPKPSSVYEELYVCRCIWTAARMQHQPKIQKWRYHQLKQVLNSYLSKKKGIIKT